MQLRSIDTNLIVALRALLVHRNVTRAGKEIGLSQSSMSHALSRLRAHFDDPLLVAVGRDLVLTERAKSLIAPVDEAVARLESVFARPRPFDPRTSQRVFRVAATDNLGLYVLPRLAAILERDAPGIDVRVCALPSDWAASLLRGDIDLKLGRKSAPPKGVECQDLARERFTCVARKGHPARRKLTVAEYAALDHLLVAPTALPGPAPHGVVDVALQKLGMRRRIRMSVPHFLVAPFVVAGSDLVLTASMRLVEPFVRSLGLRQLELPVKLAGYALSQAWSSRMRDDHAHRWLRSTIARLFDETR